jgi:hypothetical protein
MNTVRHEGFHQFFDRLVGDPPLWLNEGFADYFARSRTATGWRNGKTHATYVLYLNQLLAQGSRGLVPLPEFLSLDDHRFLADATKHYAQSWALVHFLMHSTAENEGLLYAYIAELTGGASAEEARARTFALVDLFALDATFREHVRGLAE